MEKLDYKITDRANSVRCESFMKGTDKKVSECRIVINRCNGKCKWTIAEFYTEKEFMHQGNGKLTMKHLVQSLLGLMGRPTDVEYIWNGVNEYVFDWITREFEAVCQCPIAVQKTQSDDDWSSHMYTLNKDKVLEYFAA